MSAARKIVLIGPIRAGKSTLLRALEGLSGPARKTQAISYTKLATDTPGEYLENPLYYRVLVPSAMEARWVLLIQDATSPRNHYPPNFARAFPGKSVGIITKIDDPRADVERSRRFLQAIALTGPIIAVSSVTGAGLSELRDLLGLVEPEPPAEAPQS
ncbi:MAG TPA: EutP/PduV family microcompartment system protein [Symbiobacteriaceae bacterium]|jgi:ethanolamine utilization protein EutP